MTGPGLRPGSVCLQSHVPSHWALLAGSIFAPQCAPQESFSSVFDSALISNLLNKEKHSSEQQQPGKLHFSSLLSQCKAAFICVPRKDQPRPSHYSGKGSHESQPQVSAHHRMLFPGCKEQNSFNKNSPSKNKIVANSAITLLSRGHLLSTLVPGCRRSNSLVCQWVPANPECSLTNWKNKAV